MISYFLWVTSMGMAYLSVCSSRSLMRLQKSYQVGLLSNLKTSFGDNTLLSPLTRFLAGLTPSQVLD